jgi:hypothetical protein
MIAWEHELVISAIGSCEVHVAALRRRITEWLGVFACKV